MLRFQSLEDGDGFPDLEEDEDIDQFNDDTFGAGAIDDDWREEHERLAEIEEKIPSSQLLARSISPINDPLEEQQEELEHSLNQLVKEIEEPSLPRGTRTPLSSGINSSIWESSSGLRPIRGPLLTEDMSPLSILHEYGLAAIPPPNGDSTEQDASERALPRRSTSPVIGSPPVRAVPIGTPPKYVGPMFSQQQVLCPNPIHIRAASSFNNHPSNPATLLRHPFPSALSPLQRAQLIGGAQAAAGRMSPSQFARTGGLHGPVMAGVTPKLLQGHVASMVPPGSGGFRPFFGVPSAATPGAHLKNIRPQQLQFRPDTTHLHPQHRRLLFQRQQNRNQHRGVGGSGGDRSSRSSHTEVHLRDPYAGLMLQREKEWVCRIQLLQLQSTDPYHDDFYYQNYFEKLEKLSSSQDRLSEGPKKERTRLITPQVAKLEHAYKPVQFEGSLGKLTVSSVNNPRKMIDAVATHRSDEEENREKQVRDKRRQTLIIIEKAFSVLLELEDFERRFSLCCEDEREALTEERRQKVQQLCDILRVKEGSERATEEQIVQIMCIRKGKRLVGRILPFFPLQQCTSLISTAAHSLPFLIKKDAQDQILPCLAVPCAQVVSQLSGSHVTSLLQCLCGSGVTSPQHQLTSLLQNKLGLTLLCQILDRGEELMSSECPTALNQTLWTPLVAQVAHCLLQIQANCLPQPLCFPDTALLHFSRYLDDQSLSQLQLKFRSAPSP
ncbi:protein PAT1 homolog 1 [Ranitomeya variabilis]|uniref:protein PAT1 homolog 1 n=1 Tax=Ranitomeya variabilis TaxID=490064 RepID=UPI004056F640